jgi:hypothetical protein
MRSPRTYRPVVPLDVCWRTDGRPDCGPPGHGREGGGDGDDPDRYRAARALDRVLPPRGLQHDHPDAARRAVGRDRRGRRRSGGARDPAARGWARLLRRLRARLVDRRAGPRGPSGTGARGRRARLGLGRRHADDRELRRRLHEALVLAKARARGRAGLVHRWRHRHGAVRGPDRRRRGRDLRLSARSSLGHADHGDVGVSDGSRAGEALPADGGRDPRAGGGRRWG